MSGSEAFRWEHRLRKRADFKAVYRNGSSFSKRPFVLKVLSTKLDETRIGITISAKAVKRAVRRSRIKRVFRESFRKNRSHLKTGVDLVVIVRSDPGKKFSYKNAADTLLQLSGKAGIVIDNKRMAS